MNGRIVAVVILAVAALAVSSACMVGCGKEESKPAKAPTQPAVFANLRCPIMGTAIDPDKVPDALIREYKGKKVAFCCPMCPPAWDKLTDAEKDAKLAEASKPKPGEPARAPTETAPHAMP